MFEGLIFRLLFKPKPPLEGDARSAALQALNQINDLTDRLDTAEDEIIRLRQVVERLEKMAAHMAYTALEAERSLRPTDTRTQQWLAEAADTPPDLVIKDWLPVIREVAKPPELAPDPEEE